VFYLDVVKVDLDVAYVAMTIHTCFKHVFEVFHPFHLCILQIFHLDVSKVDLVLHMLQ
jgi:hypothetical protein